MSITQTLIKNAGQHWQDYVEHGFVQQLENGTLPLANFQHYLKQDYLYLLHYNRAFALAIYKADNLKQMEIAHQSVAVLLHEIQLHIGFCKGWGIDEQTLLATPESAACVAYTRYVLDCGMTGGLPELYAAMAPCAMGYAEIGRNLATRGKSPANNPYQAWIDMYSSEEFQQGTQALADNLDHLCQGMNSTQLAKIQQIFNTATRMESAFWQMGLDLS
ncbi:thiaminase II [Pasteurella sp. PK-2025]|uniref:thiaminase II n=1 Tax=Pasteurella sp. PK-2025 TaxID=3413133 RepID=UPI003C78F9E4